MAENLGTLTVKVEPDLDEFRAAMLAIADEFEDRILSAVKRAQRPDPEPSTESWTTLPAHLRSAKRNVPASAIPSASST